MGTFETGIFALAILSGVPLINCLDLPLQFIEGPCRAVRPVSFDRETIDSFQHLSAGSKFNLYSIALPLPNYKNLAEEDLYYDACYTRNTSTVTDRPSIGASFGFGQLLGTFKITPKPGIYFEARSTNPVLSLVRVTETITLTDHKTFAVSVVCSDGFGLFQIASWSVFSLKPEIGAEERKVVEEHVKSMGFNRKNFVFLRYDSCRKGIVLS